MKEKLNEAISLLGGLSAFSKKIGVKPPTAHGWLNKDEEVPIKRCVQIEKLTNGAVTRKDLRPNDWHEIWVELLDKPTDPAQ